MDIDKLAEFLRKSYLQHAFADNMWKAIALDVDQFMVQMNQVHQAPNYVIAAGHDPAGFLPTCKCAAPHSDITQPVFYNRETGVSISTCKNCGGRIGLYASNPSYVGGPVFTINGSIPPNTGG